MRYKAGFIGAGNMGGALLSAVCRATGAENVALYDRSTVTANTKSTETGACVTDLPTLSRESQYLFLGVKPNVIPTVAAEIAKYISDKTVIVTMAAGVTIDSVCKSAGTNRVIRIMPNTPANVGEGMILYCVSDGVTENDIAGFLDIMKCSGVIDAIDERYIDAAAALSGCGPAFVYMFIDALADGAVSCGLPRDKALLYAKQTVFGSALLSKMSNKHPEQLKDDVCSPGGTTIEGVLTLENGAFRHTVSAAVKAAYKKTAKLK